MTSRKLLIEGKQTFGAQDYDLLICGASYAGLTVAREVTRQLAGRGGAKVLMIDRYPVGEHSTSACATPTRWLEAMDCMASQRQTFETFHINTPQGTASYKLPFSFSTFDYQKLCQILFEAASVPFEIATVKGRDGNIVITDRGEISARMVVDCTGWRGALRQDGPQPPNAPLSRGLEVDASGSGERMEIWLDRSIVPAGYSWCFPADGELRVGVGSFDPSYHVRKPVERLAERLEIEAQGFKGCWIPHKLGSGTDDGIFFVGDSAGQCMPLTAEGIRTAFYFGIACGREISRVLAGRQSMEQALSRYSHFCSSHDFPFRCMLRVQKIVPRIPPTLLFRFLKLIESQRFVDWSFGHYFKVAHPSLACTYAGSATPALLEAA